MAPTLSQSFVLWDRVHTLVSNFTPLDHLFHNPTFPPGLEIRAFKWWTDKGLYYIGHFFYT